MTKQSNSNNNITIPTIPATRPPKTTIRPTRASLARETMIQAKQQQRQSGAIRTSLPHDIKKTSLPSPSASTPTDSKRPRSRTSLPGATATTKAKTTSIRTNSLQKKPIMNRSQQTTTTAAAAAGTSAPATTGIKRKSLITTKESLKKRPAWDIRGKVSDMEAQLQSNKNELSAINKFKDHLETMNEGKESNRKNAIQRLVTIKAEIQKVKRNHEVDMENLKAQHRIHHQELLDRQLIYKQQEPTMEIELEDAKRKQKEAQTKLDLAIQRLQQLEDKLLQITTNTKAKEEEIHSVQLKSQRYGGTLADREREILRLKKTLENKLPALETAEIKLQNSQATNERLQVLIEQMEKA